MKTNEMMKTKRALLIAGLAMSFASMSPAIAQTAKPPLKIGVLVPLTGFAASYGEMYRVAMTMAFDDVNKAGGINGSRVELVIQDDQMAPAQSALLFRRFVSEGAVAVLGPISGSTWETVAPLANSLKTPALNWTALKPGISKKPYALRIHPADDTMISEGVAEFRKKFPAVRKIVIAGDLKEASGASGIEEFRKAAQAQKLEVIEVVGFETRTTDFSPVAIKLRGLAPDAVFLSAFMPNTLALLKEMEAQGLQRPVFANALIWAGAFPQLVGALGKNVYTIGFDTNEPAPQVKGQPEFVNRYVKAAAESTKQPPPANVANATLAYDAVMLLAQVMRDRKIDGETDVQKARDAIAEALSSLKSFHGLNRLTMRESGDGHIQSHLLEVDVQNKMWKYSLPAAERIGK